MKHSLNSIPFFQSKTEYKGLTKGEIEAHLILCHLKINILSLVVIGFIIYEVVTQ